MEKNSRQRPENFSILTLISGSRVLRGFQLGPLAKLYFYMPISVKFPAVFVSLHVKFSTASGLSTKLFSIGPFKLPGNNISPCFPPNLTPTDDFSSRKWSEVERMGKYHEHCTILAWIICFCDNLNHPLCQNVPNNRFLLSLDDEW